MKPGYKQTEVGVIPVVWESASLIAVADCLDNLRVPLNDAQRQKMQGGYPYCGANGVLDYVNDFVVDDDIILMAEDGGYFDEYASRPIAYRMREKCWVNNHAHILKARRGYDQSFLFYSLVHKNILPFLASGTRAKLNKSEMEKIIVPVPPSLTEQEAIASALGDADGLIESLERLIAKKRAIKQGAMQELLTGRRRLPGFKGEWETKQLGELLTICHGKSQHEVELQDGPYPILATGGQIGTANHYLYDKPSVLIGRKGTIDQPQYMDSPFWTVDTLFYSIIHDANDAKYIYYRFCLINWRQYNEASGVPSMNAHTIENIEIECPSPAEQTAIASVLSDMDAEITALEGKLAKARAIKQGMMQELLTGRIRLV